MNSPRTIVTLWVGAVLIFSLPAAAQPIDPRLFQPSALVSFETAKDQLKRIYLERGRLRTLHCGCYFDKLKQVFPGICAHARVQAGRAAGREILAWFHAVPVKAFSRRLSCWKKKACRRTRTGSDADRRQCCRELSPRFKTMEADMHNLFPGIALNRQTGTPRAFGGMAEYRFCRNETWKDSPRPGTRGDLARAYFYMARQYGFPIEDGLENRLRQWHFEDPPDAWEEKRNTLIELVQGNRNPFIDHPELAERVPDF